MKAVNVDGEWLEHEDDKRLKEIQDEARGSLNALMATLYNKGYQDGAKALAEHHELCMDEVDDVNEILNKIRAEIENHCGLAMENHCKYCSRCNNLMGVKEILEIIDKCKAESEEI